MNTRIETGNRARLTFPVLALVVAICAAIMLIAAGFGTRLGLWHFRTGFTILKYGGYCGLAGTLAGVAAFVVSIRNRRLLGSIISICAFVVGIASAGLPLSWKLDAGRLPRIHDITTDVVNPPHFNAIVPLRKDAPNPIEYGGAEIAADQQKAYPDLKTLIMNKTRPQAFEAALKAARQMGWRIVDSAPDEGRIEATDTTFWFGFKDDIVVRITSAGERSLVDVRSVSRVGISDVGTNARRVRAYLKKLAENN